MSTIQATGNNIGVQASARHQYRSSGGLITARAGCTIAKLLVGGAVIGSLALFSGCGGGGGSSPTQGPAPAIGSVNACWPSPENVPNSCSVMNSNLVCNSNRLNLSCSEIKVGSTWVLNVNERTTTVTVGEDGKLNFSNVVLDEGQNTIKLDGSYGSQSVSAETTLAVDTTAPQLSHFRLTPESAKEGTAFFQFDSNQPLKIDSLDVSVKDSAGAALPATFVSADAMNEMTGERVALRTPADIAAFKGRVAASRTANASYGTWKIIYSFEVPANAAQGSLTATVSAKNAIGTGTHNTVTSTFGNIDTIAPQILSATAKMNGNDVTGQTIDNGTLEVTINGNTDLKNVTEVSLNGTQGTLKSSANGVFVFSVLINLPSNTSGVLSLNVKGEDAAGNQAGYSVEEFLRVDTWPLTLPIDGVFSSLTAKVNGDAIASNTLLPAGTVVELDIATGDYFGSLTSVEVVGGRAAVLVSQNPLVYQYAVTTADTDGPKTVLVKGTDVRGNAREVSFQAFTVQQSQEVEPVMTISLQSVLTDPDAKAVLGGQFTGFALQANTISQTEANMTLLAVDEQGNVLGQLGSSPVPQDGVAWCPMDNLCVKIPAGGINTGTDTVILDIYGSDPGQQAGRRTSNVPDNDVKVAMMRQLNERLDDRKLASSPFSRHSI